MSSPVNPLTPAASILIAEDDASLCKSLSLLLTKEGYRVLSADDGNMALKMIAKEPVDLILTDLKMPGLNGIELLQEVKKLDRDAGLIMLTAFASVEVAVEAMKQGAFDFVTKPFKKSVLLATIRKALEKQALLRENWRLRQQLENCAGAPRPIFASHAMRELLDLVEQIAPTSSTVLITGESGTGKEVIAEEIHRRSERRERPLLKVSCAALPEAVIESELFGHEKGAFTGALTTHPGRFELAHGGTLLLDEIGEVPNHIQVKLLRVLQNGEFERVGGTKTLFSDARIIAATNRDLKKAIDAGHFRKDLYYRLNVIHLAIPPLRERSEEIPALALQFMEFYRSRNGKPDLRFADSFLDSLAQYSWPGNTRELENAIERAVIMARGKEIDLLALPEPLKSATGPGLLAFPIGSTLDEIQERAIEKMLDYTAGDKERAARLLGITTRTIYRHLERKRQVP